MYSNISGVKIKAGKRRGNVMDYVRILYTYIVEDFMYSGYLLLTLLLPCLIYQELWKSKQSKIRRVPANIILEFMYARLYLGRYLK